MKTHAHTRTSAGAGSSVGVKISGLQKSYRTGSGVIHAVRDLDVSIGAGQTVALLGPNGAGKSTTLDLILGLASPDAGSVSLFGQSPAEAVASGSGRGDAADRRADPRPLGRGARRPWSGRCIRPRCPQTRCWLSLA